MLGVALEEEEFVSRHMQGSNASNLVVMSIWKVVVAIFVSLCHRFSHSSIVSRLGFQSRIYIFESSSSTGSLSSLDAY
jgi:hypothetical protein